MRVAVLVFTCLVLTAGLIQAQDIVPNLKDETDLMNSAYDVVVFINDNITGLGDSLKVIENELAQYKMLNPKLGSKTEVVPFLKHPSKRLIYSPTGALNQDTTDSRYLYNAARKAIELVIKQGLRKPLLVLGPFKSAPHNDTHFEYAWLQPQHSTLIALLGALQAYYVPLTTRQLRPKSFPKYDLLGFLNGTDKIVDIAAKIETARYVTRDICGTDEERMTAIAAYDYIKDAFKNSEVKVGHVDINPDIYRMIASVNRAVNGTKYDARYVTLEYSSPSKAEVDKELYFVGKGITFDTGGASIKTGGNMLFMHNDKCGAASVAGFFKALELLKPKKLNAHGKMAFVRNGLGADMYLVDEIIKSKAGIRSRIGSTDAEGRNVMVDLITDCIEDIKNLTKENRNKAHILTVATLTGHVGLAFGKLTAVMDNGPARKSRESFKLRDGGALIADITEISSLRREDYEVCYPVSEYEDLQQRNTHANTIKYRGHQYPAAWMIMASGLSKHSNIATPEEQIKYTHVDVASSVGVHNSEATGAPTTMFLSTYVLPEILKETP
ncbi:metalloexopeptidase activity [Sparganum proliferum]